MSTDPKVIRRQKLRWRIRTKLHGTAQKRRLSVFRSNSDIYVQLINDDNGTTLVSCNSRMKDIVAVGGNKVNKSAAVGKTVAQKAIALGIEACIFDRGGY